jgi:hypothetical protein
VNFGSFVAMTDQVMDARTMTRPKMPVVNVLGHLTERKFAQRAG